MKKIINIENGIVTLDYGGDVGECDLSFAEFIESYGTQLKYCNPYDNFPVTVVDEIQVKELLREISSGYLDVNKITFFKELHEDADEESQYFTFGNMDMCYFLDN